MLPIPIVLQYETKTKINKIKRTQNEMFVFAFCLCVAGKKNALPVPPLLCFVLLFFSSLSSLSLLDEFNKL